ncbi:heliorhodopsin HeR [Ilumatobacter fluminis]|nr:heliorhodopsin HeR [Ilumatobacter fluminis]
MSTRLDHDAPTVEVTDQQFGRLRITNLALAALHATSGVLMLVLNNGFEIGISSFSIGGPPGTDPESGTVSTVWEYPLGPAVAAFAFLSALFHLIVALPPGASKYRSELEHGRNRFRWVEYSMSATLMIVIIATITGITDVAALIAIAAANIAMILFGWVMEVVNRPDTDTVWWGPFWFGCIAGAAPWIAIAANLGYAINKTDEGPPAFVWGILVSLFVLFNCFAVNQWLQYKRVGKWSDYLVGERTYGVLSLVAKTALAWQIFANVLID